MFGNQAIKATAAITIPASLAELTNEFMMEGVVSLLSPPANLVTQWIDHDTALTVQERASLLDFIALREGRQMANHTVMPAFDLEADAVLKEQAGRFGEALASRFHHYIMETIFPLFFERGFDISPDHPIVLKPFQDVRETVDESLHDFVMWVEGQIESDAVKEVIHVINGSHSWDRREQTIDELAEKNGYNRKRVGLVKEKLLALFDIYIDQVVADIAVNLKEGMHKALVNIVEKERTMIPGPRHLE